MTPREAAQEHLRLRVEEEYKLTAKLARVRARLNENASAQHQLREAILRASYPPEPTASAAMVRFEKRYSTSPKRYQFAAIKGDGRWYVTGRLSPQGVSWHELVDFVRKDNVLVAELERLLPERDLQAPF